MSSALEEIDVCLTISLTAFGQKLSINVLIRRLNPLIILPYSYCIYLTAVTFVYNSNIFTGGKITILSHCSFVNVFIFTLFFTL